MKRHAPVPKGPLPIKKIERSLNIIIADFIATQERLPASIGTGIKTFVSIIKTCDNKKWRIDKAGNLVFKGVIVFGSCLLPPGEVFAGNRAFYTSILTRENSGSILN